MCAVLRPRCVRSGKLLFSARVAGGNSGSPTLAGATQVLFLSTSMNMIVQNRISLCLAWRRYTRQLPMPNNKVSPPLQKRRRANSIYIIAEEPFREFSLLCTFPPATSLLYNNSTFICSSRGQNFLHQSQFHKINQNFNHTHWPPAPC